MFYVSFYSDSFSSDSFYSDFFSYYGSFFDKGVYVCDSSFFYSYGGKVIGNLLIT